jgi:hypothetical protein
MGLTTFRKPAEPTADSVTKIKKLEGEKLRVRLSGSGAQGFDFPEIEAAKV